MNNQPLDKGRLMAVVDTYQSKELDQNGQPKVKNKYMAIGELTRWPSDNGGSYVSVTQYLSPPKLPCELKEFWDSEQQQNQNQSNQQSGYQNQQGGQTQYQGQQGNYGGYQGQ